MGINAEETGHFSFAPVFDEQPYSTSFGYNPLDKEELPSFDSLLEGIRGFMGDEDISSEDLAGLVQVLSCRREFVSTMDQTYRNPSMTLFHMLRQMCVSYNARKDKGLYESLSDAKKRLLFQYLLYSVRGHKELQSISAPVEVGVEGDITMGIMYGLTDWEGISGVGIYAKDAKSNGFKPIYIVRGNALKNASGMQFHIRTVQPWISELAPSIARIKDHPQMLEEDPALGDMIRERQRLLDRIMKKVGDEKFCTNGEDLALLMTLTYLQSCDVRLFRGISHKKHPQVALHGDIAFQYDTFFAKWLDPSMPDAAYPWVLNTKNALCHIPHWESLHPTMRRMLIDTYRTSKEAQATTAAA